jgi:hypothetical protein
MTGVKVWTILAVFLIIATCQVQCEEKQDSDLCTPVKISECTKNPKLTQCCVVKLNGGGSGYKCCSEEDYFDQWPAMEKSNAQPRYELRRTPTLYISIGAPLGVVIFAIVCYCLCCK